MNDKAPNKQLLILEFGEESRDQALDLLIEGQGELLLVTEVVRQ